MSQHTKTLTTPKSWTTPRKTSHWIVSPRCGPHPIERSIPLLIIVRDLLKYCDNASEGKRLIGERMFLIDGKVCTDYRRSVGLMDVLSIPKTNEHFRTLQDSRGKLRIVKINEESSKWKLVRIEDKTMIRKGKTQLHLHDSRNIVLDSDKYKTGDALKIELPSQKVIDCYPMSSGNIAMLIGGKHKGELASIVNYEVTRNPKPNIVHFEKFSTTKNNVFVVGTKTPEITLPEVAIV